MLPFMGSEKVRHRSAAESQQVALVGKDLPANAGDTETWVRSWVGKMPWSRKWQPTLVTLPGKFHGQDSLVICSL